MGGPAPIPTALKILRGNPSKERLNTEEPTPAGEVSAPKHLSPAARRLFRKLAVDLSYLGVGAADSHALAVLAENYELMIIAGGHIAAEGPITMVNSQPQYNPWLVVHRKATAVVMKMLCEFGATPSSRSRLHVQKPAEDDLSEFLKDAG